VSIRDKTKLPKVKEVMESEYLEVQQIADDTLEKRRLMEEELTTVQRRNSCSENLPLHLLITARLLFAVHF